MGLKAGEKIREGDFISTSPGAGGQNKVPKLNALGKLDRSFINASFGGNGSDGAFAESSGNTQIDLGGARVFERNYTSFSLTGTASITFINPHADGTCIVIRSQGDVTITSTANPTIDLRGLGGSWFATNGDESIRVERGGSSSRQRNGAGGGNLNRGGGASWSDSGSSPGTTKQVHNGGNKNPPLDGAVRMAYPGGHGSVSGDGGSEARGLGAGALYIECAGALTFTSSVINAAGGNGVYDGNFDTGGGGAGGSVLMLANAITANTGTIILTGGTGGGSGSVGQSLIAVNRWHA